MTYLHSGPGTVEVLIVLMMVWSVFKVEVQMYMAEAPGLANNPRHEVQL